MALVAGPVEPDPANTGVGNWRAQRAGLPAGAYVRGPRRGDPIMSASTPITLSIAGSDSGGGAGIQADIKAISATGGYACTAITALTAQNTLGVQAIHAVPPAFIRQQLDSVFSDLDVRAVKVGMLGDVATIRCVAEAVRDYQPPAVIVDPVMVATSGDVLLEPAAVSSLRDELLPLADLITPNLYEAQVLLGQRGAPLPETEAELRVMAKALMSTGAGSVLVKGGHGAGDESVDVLCIDNSFEALAAPRVATRNTHGTGCTLSAAIASYCAQGLGLAQAVARAKAYISAAIAASDQLQVGEGAGPVHHFYDLPAPA